MQRTGSSEGPAPRAQDHENEQPEVVEPIVLLAALLIAVLMMVLSRLLAH